MGLYDVINVQLGKLPLSKYDKKKYFSRIKSHDFLNLQSKDLQCRLDLYKITRKNKFKILSSPVPLKFTGCISACMLNYTGSYKFFKFLIEIENNIVLRIERDFSDDIIFFRTRGKWKYKKLKY